MARARNLKPAFFMNEDLASLGSDIMVLFEGLWCHADREGRLEDRPVRIKAQVLPYHEYMLLGPITEKSRPEPINVDAMLKLLDKHGFINRYEVEEKKYIQIINFKKHQNPHIHEQASTIPAPCIHGSDTGNAGSCPADSLNPLTSTLNPIDGAEPSGSTPVIALVLNDKSEFPITEAHVMEFKKLYPNVDIVQQLRKMRGWCLSNPQKRKTKKGIMRFVNTWLAKEQDRGGNHAADQQIDNSAIARVRRANAGRFKN